MKLNRASGLLALMGVFAFSGAGAATYDVSTADSGPGSLRDAIRLANNDNEPSNINIPAGTIILSTGLPTITQPVTLSGQGARSSVITASGQRIFDIANATGTVLIERLTVRGGAGTVSGAGAGIRATGNGLLSLSQIAVENNRASTDGGGLYTASPTIVNQSTFSGNAATTGGAIAVATPPGTKVTVNVTNDPGEPAAEVKIVNSTISGNSASSAGAGINLLTAATVAITNATIAYNNVSTAGTGAGINVGVGSGAYSLIATLLAINNDPATDRNCGCSYGSGSCSFLSSGTNGVNVDTANSCNFLAGNRTNVMTDPAYGVNGAPLRILSALANNGGQTDTHEIPVTSPALDYANNVACPSVDQRGEARRTDSNGDGAGTCEAGAYEAIAYTASSTPSAPSSGGGGGGGGGCSTGPNSTDPVIPGLLLAGLAGLWVRSRQRG